MDAREEVAHGAVLDRDPAVPADLDPRSLVQHHRAAQAEDGVTVQVERDVVGPDHQPVTAGDVFTGLRDLVAARANVGGENGVLGDERTALR